MVVSGAAPVNSVPPTVTGTPTEGQALVATDGTWAGAAPIAFTYAWSRCDATGGACAVIAGATAKTYALVAADVDKSLRVTVTAKNTPGSATETSVPTAAIARLAPASVVTLPSGAKSIDVDRREPPAAARDRQGVVLAEPAHLARGVHGKDPHLGHARLLGAQRHRLRPAPALRPRDQPGEVKTGSDGTAKLTLQPTSKLPLQSGATLVMFIRARKAGDKLISGVSARRLVNLRVVPSA